MAARQDGAADESQRIITELRQERDAALAREAALAEVLRVINASPGDLTPVFASILEKAHKICGAAVGALMAYDGEHFRALATHGYPEQYAEMVRQPFLPTRMQQALLRGERFVHIPDLRAIQVSSETVPRTLMALADLRTLLMVPLRKDAAVRGFISAFRQEARAFSDNEIALLENFAAQAVIAMENARLLGELRDRTAALAARNSEYGERIEQQAAAIDVLKVISNSPDDAQPVFDLIVRRACEVCNAPSAAFFEYDGALVHFRSEYGAESIMDHGALETYRRQFPMPPVQGSFPGRSILDRRIVHVRDIKADPETSGTVSALGHNSNLSIPLLRDGAAIGAISISGAVTGGFSDSQVELLKTFAEQAVIAIGSAETYSALQTRTADLQESLEYQTATSDVLKIISRSTFDLQPVLDSVVGAAARLCEADQAAIFHREGRSFRLAANSGIPAEYEAHFKALGALTPDPSSPPVGPRAAREGRTVHVHDAAVVPGYPDVPVRLGKQRTSLGVPLLREGVVIGTFVLARQRVEPFTQRQIDLVSTFADQAVIAIENTRLLTEQREALEQQTATAEVLQVINANPGKLTPVFDAVLDKAMRLCEAEFGGFATFDGKRFISVATRGVPAAYAEYRAKTPMSEASDTVTGRIRAGANILHIDDMMAEEAYRNGNPDRRAMVDLGGGRTAIAVALRKDDVLLGAIQIYRQEVRPFSNRQITLLENFATQAVIAMDNARLITEQREALEQQTATAEVLQVINASPGDLTPVFDALLEKAIRLCESSFGTLATYDGEFITTVATRGVTPGLAEFLRDPVRPPSGTAVARITAGEPLVHITDVTADAVYRAANPARRIFADQGGARTALFVALRKDDIVLGYFAIYRQEVSPFSDNQIGLLHNFAAQAVIAMENARLINEQREALEQQTATAEVLQVINASPGNLAPVFDAILEKGINLCEAAFGILGIFDGQLIHLAATRGLTPEMADSIRQPFAPAPGQPTARLRDGEDFVHVLDARDQAGYRAGHGPSRALVDQVGARTALFVALRRDATHLGNLVIFRREVRAFSDKEIALVRNFAAQAVIAMENARLINEQREALEQQTATAEVLQVINASPGDLAPVFDTVLEKAMRLCGAAFGELYTYDGERFRTAAQVGMPAAYRAFRAKTPPSGRPGSGTASARLLESKRSVQVLDLKAEEPYRAGDASRLALVDLGGARTTLGVPLLKDGAVLGIFSIYRQEVRAFTDKQIALLENFAAQAVIAMESARLLNELRARTDELAQRQAELRVTFENMGDGVAMFDETQHLVAWNRKFQDILDVPDEIIARRQNFTDYVRYLAERGEYGPGADPDEQIRRLTERTGEYRAYERTRPDGRVIEIRHNPVPGGGFVLIYADITERKRNEAEIAAARDAAQEATRTIEAAFRELKTAQANLIQAEKMASLGQLTAGIAHEIKNPLNFVNNFAILSVELLAELKESIAAALALLTEDQRAEVEETVGMLTSNLEKITEHGKRADGIVKAMLEHSRGESGERREVDINALADEALNLAYHGARAQDQSFNITLERDFGAGIAKIEVNPQDLTRVFLNLFSNGFYAANKRARNGGPAGFAPTLKVSTRDTDGAVEIRVRDNGTGIPVDIRDKLFQPFFTTKPTGEGTGLGLSITYDIVTKQHGGVISVDSEVDAFTEFVVTLPRGMFAGEGARA